MAKDSFHKLRPIINNRNITIDTKKRVLKAYIWSILLYGCESWNISEKIKGKIEAAEMWFLRRMLRISWTEHKTNEEVLNTANTSRSIIRTIRCRQMEFLGHFVRHHHVEIEGKITLVKSKEEEDGRGRQKITYLQSLNKWATNNTLSCNELIHVCNNRVAWRRMITNACNRPGT